MSFALRLHFCGKVVTLRPPKKTAEHAYQTCSAAGVLGSLNTTGRKGPVETKTPSARTYGANNATGSLHALWPAGLTEATRNQYFFPLTIELNDAAFFVVFPIT
jgi:hypothetical protein